MKSRFAYTSPMSKRKLTRQQAWRIEKIQTDRLDRASRHAETVDQLWADGALGEPLRGRIVARFGKQVEVVPCNLIGQPEGPAVRCHCRANLTGLVTGDQVIYQISGDLGIVTALEPRLNVLARPDNRGQLKAMAANVDQIVIVTALEPAPQPELLDRYLVATEVAGIPPLIVINKVDLLIQRSDGMRAVELLKTRYQSIGYAIVEASAKDAGGLESLAVCLTDKSSVFIGQSGVGKSSLVQALLPDQTIRVGHLHQQTRLGRHTTSTARLYAYEGGGSIIDSPGIRDFGLDQISRQEVERGFVDLARFIGLCRFRDCRHHQEPGCAVQDAVRQGTLSKERLASFHRILSTLSEGNA